MCAYVGGGDTGLTRNMKKRREGGGGGAYAPDYEVCVLGEGGGKDCEAQRLPPLPSGRQTKTSQPLTLKIGLPI